MENGKHKEPNTNQPGGIGGQNPIEIDKRTAGKDLRLIGTAIRNGWPINPEMREKIVAALAGILDESEDDRNKISASKALIAADALNAKREETDVDADKPAVGVIALSVDDYVSLRNKAIEKVNTWRQETYPPEQVNGKPSTNGTAHH